MKTEKELEQFDKRMKQYTSSFPRPVKSTSSAEKGKLDPVTFAVIKARMDGIIMEMTETVIRTARNPVLYAAKDLTCSVLTYDGFLLTMAKSLPMHICCMDSSLWAVIKAFGDDIHPGDVFINNDPYSGASHAADVTLHGPIFNEGEIVAWASCMCHLIDIGAHVPSSSDGMAKDVYEEGLHFPPLRICRNYQEIPELIRFIKANFRYPEQWHGDFRAQVGSIWTADRRVKELCKKYGNRVIKRFQDEYLDYGDRRMVEEINKLPKGEWSIEGSYEKIEPLCPDGLPLKITMWIEPEEAMIYFDLTDMPDALPWGLNSSFAVARAICVFGSLPSLDPSLPRNDGVYKHFKVYMREGALIGMPKWPASTSAATGTSADQPTNMVFNLWEKVKEGIGHSGGGELSATNCSLSGFEFRQNNEPWGHMNFLGICGGPASKGYDGWPNWTSGGAMGGVTVEYVELLELKSPEIVWELGAETDSGGAGKWRGGVGYFDRIQPRHTRIVGVPKGLGFTVPPPGVADGKPGCLAKHWTEKHVNRQKVKEFAGIGLFEMEPDEDKISWTNGGGGYGDPLERDPEAVKDDTRDGFVSIKAAREQYGVVLDTEPELYEVDYAATGKLRAQMNQEKRGG